MHLLALRCLTVCCLSIYARVTTWELPNGFYENICREVKNLATHPILLKIGQQNWTLHMLYMCLCMQLEHKLINVIQTKIYFKQKFYRTEAHIFLPIYSLHKS
jgi:hypothetical protein